jgi:hypothetical protein
MIDLPLTQRLRARASTAGATDLGGLLDEAAQRIVSLEQGLIVLASLAPALDTTRARLVERLLGGEAGGWRSVGSGLPTSGSVAPEPPGVAPRLHTSVR